MSRKAKRGKRKAPRSSSGSSTLELLMAQCQTDPSAEPAFFAALLEAAVYVHAPRHDTAENLRLIQFPHPESGAHLLPFFSDVQQATEASNPRIRIVQLTGRKLFEITLGATLILNPNRHYLILYPEEVEMLLQGKVLPPVQRIEPEEFGPAVLEPATGALDWLVIPLRELYAGIPGIQSASLAERTSPEGRLPKDLVIVVVVSDADSERTSRATGAAINESCMAYPATVDIATLRPDEAHPWAMLPPFYVKAALGPNDPPIH